MTDVLQGIANEIHAIGKMICIMGTFACSMLFFILAMLCTKK